MSAILSADDLNDFISPSVACIKPIEPIPARDNAYEVTTDERIPLEPQNAQVSLTDCLACSGCVTSAEAILVSMQSHDEVLNALDAAPPLLSDLISGNGLGEHATVDGKLFVASVSPQVRASLAATYQVCDSEAQAMIEQLLCGPAGLAKAGRYRNRFTWIMDTNIFRDVALAMCTSEASRSHVDSASSNLPYEKPEPPAIPMRPILSSACPGWICYAEKTHPHVLPHLSTIKSPQALAGTMLKTVLAKTLSVDPAQIWHLAVMPCFDKKLEASRPELTDSVWRSKEGREKPIRDVDCVITAREVVMLADSCDISFPGLPRTRLAKSDRPKFPDPLLESFLFTSPWRSWRNETQAGTSGGYLYEIICMQRHLNPGSTIEIVRGRNADLVDYNLMKDGEVIFKGARYYGFRNIQNLVRKLKPSKSTASGRALAKKAGRTRRPETGSVRDVDYTYVEVMACPGGCTNGGGQIKTSDLSILQSPFTSDIGAKEWLSKVDRAYFSLNTDTDKRVDHPQLVDESFSMLKDRIDSLATHWSKLVGISTTKLIHTTYREVESDVGKGKPEVERVAALASKIGGGW